ncbi:hypothetical protein MMC25_000657 [Agyrium rufum]|nr:hypothetical protein [Agyrium rufum]
MSSISPFAVPFRDKFGNSHASRVKKRKRAAGSDEESDDDDGRAQDHGGTQEMVDDETDPDYVSGLLPNGKLPTGNFPHSSKAWIDRRAIGGGSSTSHLQQPDQQFFGTDEDTNPASLRQRHVRNLNTILHQCLLSGDYIRAGRAWGMLLREEVGSHPFDVRPDGQWGIGAEILLGRSAQLQAVSSAKSSTDKVIEDSESSQDDNRGAEEIRNAQLSSRNGPFPFTLENFEKVRTYYETLVLKYPYRKIRPKVPDALSFYPAMFGLWIYTVQEQSVALSQRPPFGLLFSQDDAEDSDDEEPPNANTRMSRRARQAASPSDRSRIFALQQAQEIESRLSELLISPPYSDDTRLRKLDEEVRQWVMNLRQPEGEALSLQDRDDSATISSEE